MPTERQPPPEGRPDSPEGQEIERRVISIHEAGHAVAHIFYGLGPIRALSVTVTGEMHPGELCASFGGHAYLRTPTDKVFTPAESLQRAIVLAAGAAAESRHCREIGAHDNSKTAGGVDEANIREIALQVASDDVAGYVERAYQLAHELMKRPKVWQAVIDLADAIHALWPPFPDKPGEFVGTLDGAEAEAIIRQGWPTPSPLHAGSRTGQPSAT